MLNRKRFLAPINLVVHCISFRKIIFFIFLYFSEGPPSANLLEEWLVGVDHMDPQGIEALQQEMEFGASDVFFRDLDEL